MEGGASRFPEVDNVAGSEGLLEDNLEHLKNLLLEHDRHLSIKQSRGEKPSLQEKRERSRIVRQLNRTRRQLYQLKRGNEKQLLKRITVRVKESEYTHLQSLAQEEGLSLSDYIRKQLFPDR
ncbi:MAG: hypothetical protein JSU72_17785 [Deltaproteobacteria bacterium]|nr:MAG: hypothetical protein JSU72_17785 [Deltaproteobacteria bacterium]